MSNKEIANKFEKIMSEWEYWLNEQDIGEFSETYIALSINDAIQDLWKLYKKMKGEIK